ncbi:MAG TPA: sulfatase-like hydrolase/transferase [Candidatus Polarisedimenticolaceae bacterium]|nr:sulfatase-like hydrolase/transferase [Candidatus Polarisedimenticolaceae bacterium]
MRRRDSLVLSLALAAAGCSGGGGEALDGRLRGAATGYNVLLVTLDTTRADRLGCYGGEWVETPALDALAASGVVFAEAVTVAPVTAPSHASMLTGLYPPSHGLRTNGQFRLDERRLTLAELLRSRGYQTAAFVSAFVLDHRFGLDQGFELYDDAVRPKTRVGPEEIQERSATEVTDAALGWLGRRTADRPFFAWVHYFDAHVPYAPPLEFAARYPNRPYAGEIAYVDSQLGRLVAALDEQGLRERTLIFVIGDHGESLGDHGELTHGFFVYDSVMRVPFIVSAPALFAGPRVVDDAVASVVDLLPTVADMLGIDEIPPLDGSSLLRGGGSTERAVYMESMNPYFDHGWSPLMALRGASDKYIRAPRAEYYRLDADPAEQDNLVGRAPAGVGRSIDRRASALGEMLERWPSVERAADDAIPLDPESLARLQSLGYVGGLPDGDEATFADPKDKIGEYERFQRASFLASTGREHEALAILEELIAAAPDDRLVLDQLAQANVFLGRLEPAEAYVRRLLAIGEDADSLMLLAQVLIAQDRLDEVDPLTERALALDPEHGTSIVVQGDLAARRGRFVEAAERYRQAARVDPYRVGPLVESRMAWLARLRSEAGVGG